VRRTLERSLDRLPTAIEQALAEQDEQAEQENAGDIGEAGGTHGA
jgi:hypothetical protein